MKNGAFTKHCQVEVQKEYHSQTIGKLASIDFNCRTEVVNSI